MRAETQHPVWFDICGFNIAILAGVLRGGRPLLGHKAAAWAAMAGILVYTILVGADAAVVRTDELGTIEVVTDGERMWWEAEK